MYNSHYRITELVQTAKDLQFSVYRRDGECHAYMIVSAFSFLKDKYWYTKSFEAWLYLQYW